MKTFLSQISQILPPYLLVGAVGFRISSSPLDNVDLRDPAMAKIAIFAALVLKLPGGVGELGYIIWWS